MARPKKPKPKPESKPTPEEPNLGGRPLGSASALTEAARAKFLEALECGMSIEEAADVADIHRETARVASQTDSVFLEGIKKAEAKGKFHHLKRIKASDEGWQANAWMLERKWWQEYAQRRPDCFTAKDVHSIVEKIVEAALTHIPDDRKAEYFVSINGVLAVIRESNGRRPKE